MADLDIGIALDRRAPIVGREPPDRPGRARRRRARAPPAQRRRPARRARSGGGDDPGPRQHRARSAIPDGASATVGVDPRAPSGRLLRVPVADVPTRYRRSALDADRDRLHRRRPRCSNAARSVDPERCWWSSERLDRRGSHGRRRKPRGLRGVGPVLARSRRSRLRAPRRLRRSPPRLACDDVRAVRGAGRSARRCRNSWICWQRARPRVCPPSSRSDRPSTACTAPSAPSWAP